MNLKNSAIAASLTLTVVAGLILFIPKHTTPLNNIQSVTVDSFEFKSRHSLPVIKPMESDAEKYRSKKDSVIRATIKARVLPSKPTAPPLNPASVVSSNQSPAPLLIAGPIIQAEDIVIPSDCHGAGNGTYYISTTNQQVTILDSVGKIIDTLAISQFWGNSPGTFYDLRSEVNSGRFFIIGDIDDTAAGLFVSDNSNPLAGWHKYTMSTHSMTDFYDQPTISFSADNVIIAGNRFVNLLADGSGPTELQLFVLNKTQALNGTLKTYQSIIDKDNFSAAGTNTTGDTSYFISTYNGYYSYLHQTMLIGTAPNAIYSDTVLFTVPMPWIADPEYLAPQKDADSANGLMVGDDRIGKAILFNDVLYFVHMAATPIYSPNPYLSTCNNAAIDFLAINPYTHKTITQFRFQDATLKQNYYYPSIAINPKGDILVAFQSSSDTNFVKVSYSLRKTTDTAFEALQTVNVSSFFGFTVFGTSGNRYGDYMNVVWDGKDFVIFCQGFGSLYDETAHYGDWQTYMVKVKI